MYVASPLIRSLVILAVIGVWLAAYLMIDRPIRALIKKVRGKREAGDTSTPFPKLRLSTEFRTAKRGTRPEWSDRINELLKQKDLLLT